MKSKLAISIAACFFAGTSFAQAVENATEKQWLDFDQQQLEIARTVPGFAGSEFADDGSAIVYMAKSASGTKSNDAVLSRVFGTSYKVVPASYNFEQLYAAKLAARAQFSNERINVRFVDIDEAKNRVVIGIDATATKAADVTELTTALQKNAIDAKILQIETLDPKLAQNFASIRDSLNPIPAAADIGFWKTSTIYGFCTIGANVVRDGVNGFVTAAHCRPDAANTAVTQPSGSLINIGTIAAYGSAVSTGCPSGQRCKYSDAMFVKYNVASFNKLGYIARTAGPSDFNISSFSRFKDVSSAPSGTVQFRKVGRTTGSTSRTTKLTKTCLDVKLDGDAFTYLCLNQFDVPNFSGFAQPGDSGAAIFIDLGNSEVRLVGILKGSITGKDVVYSPWSGVVKDLGTMSIR
jgi:hypothetical protein